MKCSYEQFREKGLRLTPQRIAVIEYLVGNTSHPSAQDIYKDLRKSNPTISYATIYNTLIALKKLGEVTELRINPDRRNYDPDTSVHHHAICTRCRKIVDVFADYSTAVTLPPEVVKDFSMTENRVDFYGVCRECKSGVLCK